METFTLTYAERKNTEQRGPSVDWERVFQQHGKRLQNFIRKRVSNHADVEDLQQMTYLEVLKHKDKFLGASRPETWVFGIALNLIRNYFKQARQRSNEISDEALDWVADDTDPLTLTESRSSLTRACAAMSRLPDETRHMLMMLLDADVSYQEIALRMDIPIGTVRSRLSRARGIIRRAVDA